MTTIVMPSSPAAAAPAAVTGHNGAEHPPLFTCLSCSIAFLNPEDQRAHYRSDLHRYNMKRRVANLPPVKAEAFNRKILERRTQLEGNTAGEDDSAGDKKEDTGKCVPCGKSFSTPNAYRDHMTSRKHRETITKKGSQTSGLEPPRGKGRVNASAATASATVGESAGGEEQVPLVFKVPHSSMADGSAEGLEETASVRSALPDASAGPSEPTASTLTTNQSRRSNLALPEDATDEQVQAAIDQKIASSKRIDPSTTCLFCISGPSSSSSSAESTGRFSSLEQALSHMQSAHSFFIPERDYLTDLSGLLGYLADKIAIGHICLYCNGRGRGFASREATQGHMIDKGHCKIAYDSEEDRLELGDFYDFSSSYPDAEKHKRKMERRKARREEKLNRQGASKWEVIEEEDEQDQKDAADGAEAAEWEDEDAEEDEEEEDSVSSDDDSSDDEDAPQARFGDNEYELVLPSGIRLGHRRMKRYYDQTMRTTPASSERYAGNQDRGSLLARRLITGQQGEVDRSGTLVKDRGGNVVRARNRGEAREAKRHVKEFRDMKRREAFKTQIGFRNNNQKHFRDPLLQ